MFFRNQENETILGFEGDFCEQFAPFDCRGSGGHHLCQNGGVCGLDPSDGSAKCSCPKEYTGEQNLLVDWGWYTGIYCTGGIRVEGHKLQSKKSAISFSATFPK